MNRVVGTCLFAVAVAVAFPSAAQTMYRCGNKYQDSPCEDGEKGRVIGPTGTKPAAPAPATAPGGAAKAPAKTQQQILDEMKRDNQAGMERNIALFKERCARGDQESCVLAICYRALVDDTQESVVACAKAHGHRVGNGWVANEEGRNIPGVPRPDWSIGITCLQKVGGYRPSATIWRKFGVPESAFDLDAEAAKACQAKYAEGGKSRR